jgi:hypothetical protein
VALRNVRSVDCVSLGLMQYWRGELRFVSITFTNLA